jgi:hypothetical protein
LHFPKTIIFIRISYQSESNGNSTGVGGAASFVDVVDLEKEPEKPKLLEKPYIKVTKSKLEMVELKKNSNFTVPPKDLLIANLD